MTERNNVDSSSPFFSQSGLARPTVNYLYSGKPGLGALDAPKSAKPAQRSCRTGPPVYLGWNRF